MAGSRRQRIARAARRVVSGARMVRSAFLFPKAVEAVPVHNAAGAQGPTPGQPITALTWNLQFAAGRKHAFFYDYGRAVSVPVGDVEEALAGIAGVIRTHDPDVVILQEVDRGARRTGGIDEHARLVEALGYPCHASTPYWRAPYVPHPRHEHLGSVDMHLSVMSRFRIGAALRRALPQKRDSWLRRRLGIQRALFEVELPFPGGSLWLIDVHFEAFSFNDGTLARQVGALDLRLSDLESAGAAWLAAGDFNSLAPGDDKALLNSFERSLYPPGETDLMPLLARWREPVGAGWATDPTRWRTYLPYGASAPDRTLDYVFHGARLRVTDHRVLHDTRWSDHLPLLTTFEISP